MQVDLSGATRAEIRPMFRKIRACGLAPVHTHKNKPDVWRKHAGIDFKFSTLFLRVWNPRPVRTNWRTDSYTHLCPLSCTHPLVHSLVHSYTRTLTRPRVHSHARPCTRADFDPYSCKADFREKGQFLRHVDLRKSTRTEIRSIFGKNKAYFSINRPYFCTCSENLPYFCTCGLAQVHTYRNKADFWNK